LPAIVLIVPSDDAHAVIAEFRNENIPGFVCGNTAHEAEFGRYCRTTVSAERALSSAGNGGDDAGRRDLAHTGAVSEEKVARRIPGSDVSDVEGGSCRPSAIWNGRSPLWGSAAGKGRNHAVVVDFADAKVTMEAVYAGKAEGDIQRS
jgi:hypothetical protein